MVLYIKVIAYCCCSVTQSCPTLCDRWTAVCQPSLSFTISQSLLRLMSIELMMPSNQLFPSPPSSAFSLSQHQNLFQGVSYSHQIGQSIGASASVSFFPMNIQGCLPLGLTGFISLLSKGLSRVFSSTTVQKHQFFGYQTYKL